MILDAAAEIAQRDGLERLTVRRVAEAAGVSAGLVFHHFETKDGLLLGLLADQLERTLDAQELEADAARGGQDRLLALVAEEIAGLRTQTGNVALLFEYYFLRRDDLFREVIRRALREYGAVFAPAARAASTDDVAAEELVHLVISIIEGAAVSAIVAPEEFRPERLIATLASVLLPPGA